jgi:hypothetical protein
MQGQFIMALATTSAVWRSTGGDQTRTAYAGSMEMIAQFYIANAAAATANVVVSSTNNAAVILPANATVLRVTITNPSTGGNSTCNVGFTPITNAGLGTNVPQAFLAASNVTARTTFSVGNATSGASLGNVANSTNLVVVTSAIGAAGAAAGPVTGLISYYVADNGQQNV